MSLSFLLHPSTYLTYLRLCLSSTITAGGPVEELGNLLLGARPSRVFRVRFGKPRSSAQRVLRLLITADAR